jgi:hypothetical protein
VDKLLSRYPKSGNNILLTIRDLREAPTQQLHFWHARQQRHDVKVRGALDMAVDLVSTQTAYELEGFIDEASFAATLFGAGRNGFDPESLPRCFNGHPKPTGFRAKANYLCSKLI